MQRADAVIRRFLGFLHSDLGKAAVGAAGRGVVFLLAAARRLSGGRGLPYLAIHRFRPVAAWLYRDLRMHLSEARQRMITALEAVRHAPFVREFLPRAGGGWGIDGRSLRHYRDFPRTKEQSLGNRDPETGRHAYRAA